ncbi:MAG: glutamine synthetase [Proteobacteria bacterium]|nr:glutamine synthetase [Pseudomonadota bacterium]
MASQTVQRELSRYLEQHPETRFLEPLMPDINGILRGKRLGVDDFDKAFGNGLNFCGAATLMDSKGNTFDSIPYGNNDGDPDVLALAVPGSLAPVPWLKTPTGQFLLEMVELDGSPYPWDPRNVLRQAMQPLYDLGLQPVLATELEFYLVVHDGEKFIPRVPRIPGSDLPQGGAQFAMMEDLYDVDEFINDLLNICGEQNIPASTALSEYAPGQFEVNLHHVDDPVLACDHAVLLKRAVKAAARKNDLAATFMAKPFADTSGSGLHIHVSMPDDDGNNIFAGTSSDGDFSNKLRHAIGGLGELMAQCMAIFAPNANSYRRFAPNTYVPSTPSWGPNHRDVALRIPLSSATNTRIEVRVAGADSNPYLVVASILAGIHHGITHQSDPGKMVHQGELLEHDVTLPVRWLTALDAFDAGTILPGYLGEEYHKLFSLCRREEEGKFSAEIPAKDYEWYLRAV